jgi:ribulose kinase
MVIAPMEEAGDKLVAGICGQVDGSILPGMLGLEAGQSAFGDVYAWFAKLLMWPVEEIISGMTWIDNGIREKIREEVSESMISELSKAAEKLRTKILQWLLSTGSTEEGLLLQTRNLREQLPHYSWLGCSAHLQGTR